MRTCFVLFCFIGLSSVAGAAEITPQTMITPRSISPCDFWTNISTPTSFGYACASYPMRMEVPDYFSTQRAVDQLEDRIRKLESRIEELEAVTEANSK